MGRLARLLGTNAPPRRTLDGFVDSLLQTFENSRPGLTAEMFQRRTSIVRFDRKSLARSLPTIATFSAVEGLDAHGRSAAIRLEP